MIPTKKASIREYLTTVFTSLNLPSANLSEIILEIAAGKEYDDNIRNNE